MQTSTVMGSLMFGMHSLFCLCRSANRHSSQKHARHSPVGYNFAAACKNQSLERPSVSKWAEIFVALALTLRLS
jgi:hypothetical protein